MKVHLLKDGSKLDLFVDGIASVDELKQVVECLGLPETDDKQDAASHQADLTGTIIHCEPRADRVVLHVKTSEGDVKRLVYAYGGRQARRSVWGNLL